MQARRDLEALVRLVFDLPHERDLTHDLIEITSSTELDLSVPAAIYPPRTKQQWALQLRQKLANDVDLLMTFAAAGIEGPAIRALDDILNSSSFGALARDVLAFQSYIKMDDDGGTARDLSARIEHFDKVITTPKKLR